MYAKRREEYEGAMEIFRQKAKSGDPLAKIPAEPAYVHYTVDDSTPEAVVNMCAGNPRGLFLPADEGSSFLSFGRYGANGRKAERGMYLRAYEGDPWKTTRCGRPTVATDVAISILMAIQPKELVNSMKETDGADCGLLQRFFLISPPENYGPRPGTFMSEDIVDRYTDLITDVGCINLSPNLSGERPQRECPANDDTGSQHGYSWLADCRQQFELDEEAKKAAKKFEDETRQELQYLHGTTAEFWSKLRGVVLRVAGLFALADGEWYRHDNPSVDYRIDKPLMDRAILFTTWMANETCRVYREMRLSGGVQSAETLSVERELAFIREQGGETTRREFYRKFHRVYPRMKMVADRLDLLQKMGVIIQLDNKRIGLIP